MHLFWRNRDETDFTGGVEGVQIRTVEERLGVTFPSDYIWFLEQYGSGGLFGVDILGIGKSSIPSVVSQTERYRRLGLPVEFIVIENCGEFAYCLRANNDAPMQASIVCWDRVSGNFEEREAGFLDFLTKRLVEAKENWEEDF